MGHPRPPAGTRRPALRPRSQDLRPPPRARGGAVRRTLEGLTFASRHRAFWALAIAFAICGATTNGLIGIHFIPSAHDHGMATTTAAGLLAAVGVFDIAGTIASRWLTDKDVFGAYTYAWWGGAAICAVTAVLSILARGSLPRRDHRAGLPRREPTMTSAAPSPCRTVETRT